MELLTQFPNCKRKLDSTVPYHADSQNNTNVSAVSWLCLQGWKCCMLAHDRSCQVRRAYSSLKRYLIGCDTMSTGRWLPMFQRCLLCTSSSIHLLILHLTFNVRSILKDKMHREAKGAHPEREPRYHSWAPLHRKFRNHSTAYSEQKFISDSWEPKRNFTNCSQRTFLDQPQPVWMIEKGRHVW